MTAYYAYWERQILATLTEVGLVRERKTPSLPSYDAILACHRESDKSTRGIRTRLEAVVPSRRPSRRADRSHATESERNYQVIQSNDARLRGSVSKTFVLVGSGGEPCAPNRIRRHVIHYT